MRIDEVIASGGVIWNPELARRSQDALDPALLRSSADLGIDSDAKEAIVLAILANESFHGWPANLPSATGARHPCLPGRSAGRRFAAGNGNCFSNVTEAVVS